MTTARVYCMFAGRPPQPEWLQPGRGVKMALCLILVQWRAIICHSVDVVDRLQWCIQVLMTLAVKITASFLFRLHLIDLCFVTLTGTVVPIRQCSMNDPDWDCFLERALGPLDRLELSGELFTVNCSLFPAVIKPLRGRFPPSTLTTTYYGIIDMSCRSAYRNKSDRSERVMFRQG